MTENGDRRPIGIRGAGIVQGIGRFLAGTGLTPNQISFAGILFAALAGASFWLAGSADGTMRTAAYLVGAFGCQMRLACNMFDGLVAVEGGKGTADGPFWNEFPDRVADILILLAAGYGVCTAGILGPELGWAAALFAVMTAYVRELGHGLGLPADFSGPMAKPRRMFFVTLGAVVAVFETGWNWNGQSMAIALGIVAVGAALTMWLRARRLIGELRKRG